MGMLLSKDRTEDSSLKNHPADVRGEYPRPSSRTLSALRKAHEAPNQVSRSTRGPHKNDNTASHEIDRMRFVIAFKTQVSPHIRLATERYAGTLSASARHQIESMTATQIATNHLREIYKKNQYRLTPHDEEEIKDRINDIVARIAHDKAKLDGKAMEVRRGGLQAKSVKEKQDFNQQPLPLGGKLKENVEGVVDLSLLGPGESSTKSLKRTADGRLKVPTLDETAAALRLQVRRSSSRDPFVMNEQNRPESSSRSARIDSLAAEPRKFTKWSTNRAALDNVVKVEATLPQTHSTKDTANSHCLRQSPVLRTFRSNTPSPMSNSTHTDRSISEMLRAHIENRSTDELESIPPSEAKSSSAEVRPDEKARFRSVITARKPTGAKTLRRDLDSNEPIRHAQSSHPRACLSSLDSPRTLNPSSAPPSKQDQQLSHSTSSLIRWRELGYRGGRSRLSMNGVSEELRIRTSGCLKPWRSWTGASNDIMVVAWSPDNISYAVGASAQTDESSMQYNRPNNLLCGSLSVNTLWELPAHRVDRPLPATGPNSKQATYDACDPDLYMSVTSVHFSASGQRLYSASYDRTVKIWDASNQDRRFCLDTLVHDAEVEVMATSGYYNEHLATGSRQREEAIRLYTLTEDGSFGSDYFTLSSARAQKSPKLELYPSCLQWGINSHTQHLLLAGFSPKDRDDSDDPGKEGDLCLWDLAKQQRIHVFPDAQNVFDAVWHPSLPLFAVGSIPRVGTRTFRSTRSALRTYEPLRMSGSIIEYECPALDINDVSFCPTDPNYITAGCTNGVTYVWDFRNPLKPVHQLEHGYPIAPMKPDMTREQSDMGVRLAAWGESGSRFYTGSSDGVIKSWNIKLASEDVHVRNVAHLEAGVMCGAFSPDFTNMLVGDARGSVHILSTAPITPSEDEDDDDVKAISFICADGDRQSQSEGLPSQDDGKTAVNVARALIANSELIIHPLWGAGQGPKYQGPFA
ncbi:MAG: hypothetical protein M1830_003814, partial [Pleopsidium flavum]